LKGKLLSILGANMNILGANKYILSVNMYIHRYIYLYLIYNK